MQGKRGVNTVSLCGRRNFESWSSFSSQFQRDLCYRVLSTLLLLPEARHRAFLSSGAEGAWVMFGGEKPLQTSPKPSKHQESRSSGVV